MTRYGLLIDYKYCTGCHSCEVACQTEHELAQGQWGIKLAEIGPWEVTPGEWQWDYVPVPTKQCDLCAERVATGKPPTCVSHCQASVMKYGPLEELYPVFADEPRQVVFAPL